MTSTAINWIFASVLVVVGVLNMFLVHPVPGVAYLFLSLIYFPPANVWLKKKSGFSIPIIVKIVLGVVIFMFTLGVSELGEMID